MENILQRLSCISLFKPPWIRGFRNDKSLKDYLVRTALPKMDNPGGSEPFGKVCDYAIRTNTFNDKSMGSSI